MSKDDPKQFKQIPHIAVAGYTPQTEDNIKLVNAMKRSEEIILRSLDAIEQMPLMDKRWLSIGRTHIQQGFMAINRAVFRPTRLTEIE